MTISTFSDVVSILQLGALIITLFSFWRSRRKEFWLFTLGLSLVSVAIAIVFGKGQTEVVRAGFSVGYFAGSSLTALGQVVNSLFSLATIIPSIAVTTRRLHDTGRSGWWYLLIFVPLFGWIALLVFYCQDGTRGGNRFGHDPKQGDLGDVFS